MAHQSRKTAAPLWDFRGIEIEVFVAGVLAILLCLAAARAFLHPIMLPVIGVAAFAGMALLGVLGMVSKPGSRWHSNFMLELTTVFAIVWIAAGRLYAADL